MTKKELGISYFKQGYNCAQAVILAFADEIGLDKESAVKFISGFGGGFGRMREVCGAVSGMTMVLSYLKSDGEDKLSSYALIKEACDKVKEKLGSIICSELMQTSADGKQKTKSYKIYKKILRGLAKPSFIVQFYCFLFCIIF